MYSYSWTDEINIHVCSFCVMQLISFKASRSEYLQILQYYTKGFLHKPLLEYHRFDLTFLSDNKLNRNSQGKTKVTKNVN